MGVDGELGDILTVGADHTFDGSAGLTLVQYDRLSVEQAPAIVGMTVDAHGRGLATWIETGRPDAAAGLEAHHIGRGQIVAAPAGGNRVTLQEREHGIDGVL